MKSLKTIISEKLILQKQTTIPEIKYRPKSHGELEDLIFKLFPQDSEYIDARSIDVSAITKFDEIFEGYTEVKAINLTGWNVSNGLTFDSMFHDCDKLENIIGIEKFKFTKDPNLNLSYFFFSCRSLEELDLSSWDVGTPFCTAGMFWGCWKLKKIEGLPNWNMSNVKTTSMMFNGCYKLEDIGDISEWKLSKCNRLDKMFYGCYELTTIGDISRWKTETIQFDCINEMFYGCKKLIADCSEWKFSTVINEKQLISAFKRTSKKLLKPTYE